MTNVPDTTFWLAPALAIGIALLLLTVTVTESAVLANVLLSVTVNSNIKLPTLSAVKVGVALDVSLNIALLPDGADTNIHVKVIKSPLGSVLKDPFNVINNPSMLL